MCGENPEDRMDELCMRLDDCGQFLDDDGEVMTTNAEEVAKVLSTSPQVAGKIMCCFDDIWKREVVKGKVVYTPINK